MDLKELSAKYDEFVNSYLFPMDEKARYLKKNADLNRLQVLLDNMACNLIFFKNYFVKTSVGDDAFDVYKNFSILIDGNEIILNTNDAPDFNNKDEYLNWLLSVINAQIAAK